MVHCDIEQLQTRLETVTRKWWFFLVLLLLQMMPPLTTEPVGPDQAGLVIGAVLSQAIVNDLAILYPIFKILAILMISSIFILKTNVSQYFSIYVGIFYVLVAFLQSIAFTEEFGFAVVTVNMVMFLMVGVMWFWEAAAQKNVFDSPQRDLSRTWVVPFALLAFWYPINMETMALDFNPLLLLTGAVGLTFCMMTPIFLSVLILFYPNVNLVTMRLTALVGVIIAFYNILTNFVIFPDLLFWNGVFHIPLTVVSVYALILSLRHVTNSS
ncbi:MAG: hypothetical protein JW779_14795 [Candidatus Thorarchaeota archaeon]|nr:hypothetical protein [Candidatus Thorarchaeota archaeon]